MNALNGAAAYGAEDYSAAADPYSAAAVAGYGAADYTSGYEDVTVAAVPARGAFRGGMRGMRGAGGMRGGGFAARGAAFGGMAGGRGGRGMSARGGGRIMRGGGRGASQRFNPLAGGFGGGAGGAEVPGHIVFAYNIGPMTGEEDVRQLFSLYGTVVKVDVIWDYAKNMGKGYAFVTMPNYEEAAYAISQLNGYNYAGKPLQVSFKSNKGQQKTSSLE